MEYLAEGLKLRIDACGNGCKDPFCPPIKPITHCPPSTIAASSESILDANLNLSSHLMYIITEASLPSKENKVKPWSRPLQLSVVLPDGNPDYRPIGLLQASCYEPPASHPPQLFALLIPGYNLTFQIRYRSLLAFFPSG